MGAVALPVHRLLKQEEIDWLIQLAKPRLAIGTDFHLTNLPVLQCEELLVPHSEADLPIQPTEEDIALLRITSGTTGRPKVIQVTHRQLCRRVANPGIYYQTEHIYGCPFPYAFPGYHIMTALGAGGQVVFRHAAT